MSQFTKSGFCKPFSCCGHWEQCVLGKNEDRCFYKKIDPETMLNCKAYKRNQKIKTEQPSFDMALALFDEMLLLTLPNDIKLMVSNVHNLTEIMTNRKGKLEICFPKLY